MCLFLAQAGHFGGNPQTVAQTELKYVLQMYQYEIAYKDYERKFQELNRTEK